MPTLEEKFASIIDYASQENGVAALRTLFAATGWEDAMELITLVPFKNVASTINMRVVAATIITLPTVSTDAERVKLFIDSLRDELNRPQVSQAALVSEVTPVVQTQTAATTPPVSVVTAAADTKELKEMLAAFAANRPALVCPSASSPDWSDGIVNTVATTAAVVATMYAVATAFEYVFGGNSSTGNTAFSQMMDGWW